MNVQMKLTRVICFVSDSRWLPESARWLLANGKAKSAQFYLSKCAKVNKRQSAKFKLEVRLM